MASKQSAFSSNTTFFCLTAVFASLDAWSVGFAFFTFDALPGAWDVGF
jgi:hypothetical protein